MMINLRMAAPSDAESISALIMSFQPLLTVDPSGRGADEFFASVSSQAERSYIESARYDYTVAEHGGALVGVVAVRDNNHLFHLFVAAPHQRAGIARMLWNHARERARQRGNPGRFTVNASLIAVEAYERLGFRRCGDVAQAHGIAFVPMRFVGDACEGRH